MLQIQTRKSIYFGIHFAMTPMVPVDTHFKLRFQQSLGDSGIDYGMVNQIGTEISIMRGPPKPLQITVASQDIGPGNPGIGHLIVVSNFPERPLDEFGEETEKIVRAYEALVPTPNRQVLTKDATIRDLYHTGGAHAFQTLWETILGQEPENLQKLGREVQGGGLRFVMPPRASDQDPVEVELKIESFLRDVTQMYLDVHFTWPAPSLPGAEIAPIDLLNQLEIFITNNALKFIGA